MQIHVQNIFFLFNKNWTGRPIVIYYLDQVNRWVSFHNQLLLLRDEAPNIIESACSKVRETNDLIESAELAGKLL